MGNDDKAQIEGVGVFELKLNDGTNFDLVECLYAPSLRRNLLSVSMLEKLGYEFYFGNGRFLMKKNDKVVLHGFRNNNMYQVQLCGNVICNVELDIKDNATYLWHLRLGQIPYNYLRPISQNDSPKSPKEKLNDSLCPYASAVGSLMYAMICTRPDIAFAVSMISRFQSNPGKMHWIAIQWILRYLKQTKGFRLTYCSDHLNILGYSDSDYQGCVDSRKSTSGFVFTFCGGAIAWKSKKQECVAQSTMEAEYIALNAAAKEAVYLRKFLLELLIVDCVEKPIPLLCDNNSAIAITKDPKCHSRAKHIEGRYHYIRDVIKKNEVVVERVPSQSNLADPFTKGLPFGVFTKHVMALGLC